MAEKQVFGSLWLSLQYFKGCRSVRERKYIGLKRLLLLMVLMMIISNLTSAYASLVEQKQIKGGSQCESRLVLSESVFEDVGNHFTELEDGYDDSRNSSGLSDQEVVMDSQSKERRALQEDPVISYTCDFKGLQSGMSGIFGGEASPQQYPIAAQDGSVDGIPTSSPVGVLVPEISAF